MNRLCEIVAEQTGKPASSYKALIRFVTGRPGHDQRYAIDCSKIKRDFCWSQSHDFEEGLRSSVRWHLEPRDWVQSVRTGEYRKWIDKNYVELNRI